MATWNILQDKSYHESSNCTNQDEAVYIMTAGHPKIKDYDYNLLVESKTLIDTIMSSWIIYLWDY